MKKNIFILIIGIFIGSIITVSATILYNAKDIEFNPSDASWNVNNMQDAVNDIKDNYISKSSIKDLINNISWSFSYSGKYEEYDVPLTGTYKIELWGAQGGNSNSTYVGGKGAYTSGIINLKEGDTLFFYVGKVGYSNSNVGIVAYNGGGYCGVSSSNGWYSGSGGGATDVRLVSGDWDNFDSLKSRIMVAAGGGGGSIETNNTNYSGIGGVGGTLTGVIGTSMGSTSKSHYGTASTQITGGTSVSNSSVGVGGFGYGGNSYSTTAGSGGGGGYYGGGGASNSAPGAGGSSFISGYTGCDAIAETSTSSNIVHTGQSNHYSGMVFMNAKMIAGNASMPTHDGASTMTGNTGNGYAKITLISID